MCYAHVLHNFVCNIYITYLLIALISRLNSSNTQEEYVLARTKISAKISASQLSFVVES